MTKLIYPRIAFIRGLEGNGVINFQIVDGEVSGIHVDELQVQVDELSLDPKGDALRVIKIKNQEVRLAL